mmetsp:Transcript_27167/g.52972  ORF Transcript_27167/g.52972 Transcript_27167/m.52972 type:complete len:282 (+) Transcript_27167:330-1175(+)
MSLPGQHLRLRQQAPRAAAAAWHTVAAWTASGVARTQQRPCGGTRAASATGDSGRMAQLGGGGNTKRTAAGVCWRPWDLRRTGATASVVPGGWIGVASGRRGMNSPFDAMNMLGGSAEPGRTIVESYTQDGFVVNQTFVEGAAILLPRMIVHWNVTEMSDITFESLSILRIMQDKPEMLLVGTGRRVQRLPSELIDQIKKMGLQMEVMDSINAVATFNVLNEEGRQVVVALMPLEAKVEAAAKDDDEDDILKDMPRPKMSRPSTNEPDRPARRGGTTLGGF